MKSIFHAYYNGDCYEIHVRDMHFVKIIKHSSGSGLIREVDFAHLNQAIQETIIDAFTDFLIQKQP